jgi:hypothetical protein
MINMNISMRILKDFLEPLHEQKTIKELMEFLNSWAQYGRVKFVLATIRVLINSNSMLMI